MNDQEKAVEALRQLASYKMEESGMGKRLEDKSKLKLNQLGISPENAARSAALMKVIADASQGSFGQDFGNFDIRGKLTPEERSLKLGWKRDF